MAAVQAGYQVAAFDIFNDHETRRFSAHSEAIPFRDGGFDFQALLEKLHELDAQHIAGFAYGSGLEGQPELIHSISERFKRYGNSAETVAQVKTAPVFFALLDDLGIRHPAVSDDIPHNSQEWLVKTAGGSGGTHIRHNGQLQQSGDYFQQKINGVPVSVLFLADGVNTQVIGYNEQWLAPTASMPYRYGGAVSQAALPQEICQQMQDWAAAITRATGLRGINSMDCLLTVQGLMVLEINPRLSATMALYDIPDLFERHMQACTGVLKPLPEKRLAAKAQHIVYASRAMCIPPTFAWPDWVVDLPSSGSVFEPGQPVCTVLAAGEDTTAAKHLAFARAQQIDAQLTL